MRIINLSILLVLIIGCDINDQNTNPIDYRPNILWIVAEDLSPIIPSFGDSTIVTPNLSKLAKEGICYDRVFSPSGVCAPSRAAIVTGMYPINIGANHMRTGPWFPNVPQQFIDNYARTSMPQGIVPYEAVPRPEVKMMSEYLRAEGYYCSNNAKEDYQFRKSLMAWDESSRNAHWRNRKKGQPFFSVFNIEVTHESKIWAKAKDTLLVPQDLIVPIPPYLPNTDSAKMDIRRMYSNIIEMDGRVGEIIAQLEEDGLLESTIIFWYTDHGGPLPRQKRLTYDSGIRVPMIIRFPNMENAGTRDGQLISFIDFAPTVLSLAGIKPGNHFDGRAFLGKFSSSTERAYIHAAADRFDELIADPIRTVRDARYKYIRYYDQKKPMFYAVNYRNQMTIMRELYRLKDNDQLTAEQALWFRKTKPEEELFDTDVDPHEIRDLAYNKEYSEIRNRLSEELDRWLASINDVNMKPEMELLSDIWPEGTKPVTAVPQVKKSESGLLSITCMTEGASIGYRIYEGTDTSNIWNVYKHPIQLNINEKVTAVAHRLGYFPSPAVFEK